MSVFGGPRVIHDGLVTYYDTFNPESYVGEPTVNVVTNPNMTNLTNWNMTQWPYGNYGPNETVEWTGENVYVVKQSGYDNSQIFCTNSPTYYATIGK